MKVTTGYGYFKDTIGNIVCKYELPLGEHPLKPGYTFHEVANKAALDLINVYVPPKTITEQQTEKIALEIHELAKASLIAKGEWPT